MRKVLEDFVRMLTMEPPDEPIPTLQIVVVIGGLIITMFMIFIGTR